LIDAFDSSSAEGASKPPSLKKAKEPGRGRELLTVTAVDARQNHDHLVPCPLVWRAFRFHVGGTTCCTCGLA